jgi:aspartate/methionine/tyrosine aminotransferase
LLDELPKAGLGRIVPADGAFYLYVDVGEFATDSVAFTKEMLAAIGIAATPGVDFDAERGSRYVRFCYAGTTADMAEAARRLKGWSRLKSRA